jgi:hypothetical protein
LFLKRTIRVLLFDANAEKAQEEFFKEVKKNIQEAEYDKKVEAGMLQLIQDIVSGKVQNQGASETEYSRQDLHLP